MTCKIIVKRSGEECCYNRGKVLSAMRKAYEEVKKDMNPIAEEDEINLKLEKIAEQIELEIEDHASVELVQDLIEKKLFENGLVKIVRRYIKYRDEREQKRLDGWKLDDLQNSILERKYMDDGEDFEGWLVRAGGKNPRVIKLMRDMKFLFGGRILAHRGLTAKKVTLSNCYVQPAPEDNLESIFDTAKGLARTYSYGGGCGVDISKLRPSGAIVNNSARTTTGGVSFMKLYDLVTELIGQNGRRGALMISISDRHPDLLEFIDIKAKQGSITCANISIRITDEFIKAVEDDADWELRFTVEGTGEVISKTLKARDILRRYATNNYDWGEPGNLYWSRIENWHMMSHHPKHKYDGVNPCAEEPLLPWGSCNIGSIALDMFVVHPFTPIAYFDFEKFGEAVMTAIVGLNEVLDDGMELHPLQEQRDVVRQWRPIGLGIMALADMLIKLGIRYDSEQALELCSRIARYKLNKEIEQSALLAKKYGPFPMYDKEALFKSPFFIENINDEVKALVELYGIYNSQVGTIAPTGSTATMLGKSSGIEPLFAISFRRKTESLFGKDVYFDVYTPIVKEVMERVGGSKLPDYIVTSHDIAWKDRLKMQSVWQRYIDASISSTVNLPNSATVDDIMDIYIEGSKLGLKGITVFRDGCKRAGVLTVSSDEDKKENADEAKMNEAKVDEGASENAYSKDEKYVKCAECGEPIELITNGCSICQNCGYSPCS